MHGSRLVVVVFMSIPINATPISPTILLFSMLSPDFIQESRPHAYIFINPSSLFPPSLIMRLKNENRTKFFNSQILEIRNRGIVLDDYT